MLRHNVQLLLICLLALPLFSQDILNVDAIEITSTKENESKSEMNLKDSYTTRSMSTSTKLNISPRETPQSVSVITSEEMKDKQLNSFHDVLSTIPGLSINNRGDNYVSFVRGFDMNYFKIDGMPTYSTVNHNNFDTIIYDRIEIVKGANGLTTGQGDPSFAMNFIRKHATSREVESSVSVSTGSWDTYAQSIDVSTPISEDKHIRSRFIAKNEDSKAFYDHYDKSNQLFYGVIDADINDMTSISLGATYQNLERKGAWNFGLPAFYSDISRTDFPRKTALAPEWAYSNIESKEIFGSLKQYLHDDIAWHLSSSFNHINDTSNTVQYSGKINKTTGSGLTYNQYAAEKIYDEHNIDTYVSIPFHVYGLSQEIITGFSYNERTKDLKDKELWPSVENIATLFNYRVVDALTASSFVTEPSEKTTQLGSYIAGKFSLSNDLKFISGLRVSNWKYDNDSPSIPERTFNNELTPYAGLVYHVDAFHSIYASYTDIFKPQSVKDIDGHYLDPIVGQNYETGIKGEYFGGKLNTFLTFFKIVQDNAPTNGIKLSNGEWAYEATKGVMSKGVEVGASGEITDRLGLAFGLANFNAEDAKGVTYNTKASRTTMSAFTKYKLTPEFSIGGGMNYYSKFYTGSGSSLIEQEAFTLVNLMARYHFNKHTEAQLNINNVFDKHYYEGIGNNLMVYGAPRNAMLSLKYSF